MVKSSKIVAALLCTLLSMQGTLHADPLLTTQQIASATFAIGLFHTVLAAATVYGTYKAGQACNTALQSIVKKPVANTTQTDKVSESGTPAATQDIQPNYGGTIGWSIVTAVGGYHALSFTKRALRSFLESMIVSL